MIATDPLRPDLGGNHIGGDPCSWTPALWEHLLRAFNPASVLDVGCGEGHAVQWFLDHGVSAIGTDGLRDNILRSVAGNQLIWHDLTAGAYRFPAGLVWCCEVVEHIEERHIDNLLTTLCNGAVIAMTHALPGQQGWHHCNCQPDEYWVERICARGYDALDPAPFRRVAAMENERSWFSRSGLVFRRCPAP